MCASSQQPYDHLRGGSSDPPLSLAVEVVRFVDETQPGWVACEFQDVEGNRHTFIDKVPIFTAKFLDTTSSYPQLGTVRCEILGRFRDEKNRELAKITTVRPDYVESTDGLSEFTVLSTQLQPIPMPPA